MDGEFTAHRTVVRRNAPFISPLILLAGCGVVVVIGIVIGALAPLSHARIPMNHMRAAHSAVQLIAADGSTLEGFQPLVSHVIFANLLRQALSIQCWLPVTGQVITTNYMGVTRPE